MQWVGTGKCVFVCWLVCWVWSVCSCWYQSRLVVVQSCSKKSDSDAKVWSCSSWGGFVPCTLLEEMVISRWWVRKGFSSVLCFFSYLHSTNSLLLLLSCNVSGERGKKESHLREVSCCVCCSPGALPRMDRMILLRGVACSSKQAFPSPDAKSHPPPLPVNPE